MAKVDRWYPNRQDFQSHEQWDAHIQTLTRVYDLHDQLTDTIVKLQDATSNIRRIQAIPAPGGATNTMIGGFLLKPATPSNGQKLTYNSTTGQVEWQ